METTGTFTRQVRVTGRLGIHEKQNITFPGPNLLFPENHAMRKGVFKLKLKKSMQKKLII